MSIEIVILNVVAAVVLIASAVFLHVATRKMQRDLTSVCKEVQAFQKEAQTARSELTNVVARIMENHRRRDHGHRN